jgi:tartrate-resistant acid phosphatase type 5
LSVNSSKWKVLFGHHPYLSNGDRGPIAGSIVHNSLPADPYDGRHLKLFYDDYVCNNFDLYISGHDHTLQALPGTSDCSGVHIVNGAGSFPSPDGIVHDQPSYFGVGSLGFGYLRIGKTSIRIQMINSDGEVMRTHTITKNGL